MVKNPISVYHNGITAGKFPNIFLDCSDFTNQNINTVSTVSQNKITSPSHIREISWNTNLTKEIAGVIANSWGTTAQSSYESFLRQWFLYVTLQNLDPCTPDVNTVMSFMHGMYTNAKLYGGFCVAHSALSSVIKIKSYAKLSQHPFISRYLKDI